MLAGDGPFFADRRKQMGECLYRNNWHQSIKTFYEGITVTLLKKWSYEISKGTRRVDIIRDVGNSGRFNTFPRILNC